MKEYQVIIKEFLEKAVSIEASSQSEAIQLVKNKYKNEDIVLSEENFVTTEFDVDEGKKLKKDIVFLNSRTGIQYVRDMIEK